MKTCIVRKLLFASKWLLVLLGMLTEQGERSFLLVPKIEIIIHLDNIFPAKTTYTRERTTKKQKRESYLAYILSSSQQAIRPLRHALKLHQPHRGHPRQYDLDARSMQRNSDRQRLLPRILATASAAPYRCERRG
jgi:glutathione S-transferase